MKIALGTVFILVAVIGLACWAFATVQRQYRLYGRNWPWQKAVPPIEDDLDLLHACGGDNGRWVLLEGMSSGSTGEAKFKCNSCGKEEFRGGWGSSIWLERKSK